MAAPAESVSAQSPKAKPWVCTHCRDGLHRSCLRAARVPVRVKGEQWRTYLWRCTCSEPGCPHDRMMCTECKHEGDGEINPDTWRCVDGYACLARLDAKRDSNPIWRQLQDCKTAAAQERRRKALMNELAWRNIDPDVDATIEQIEDRLDAERKQARQAPKKPKTAPRPTSGVCECGCGGKTKGGRFQPGHDAKLASALKERVETGDADAWAEMVRRGWTKKLPAALRTKWEEAS